MQHAGDERTNYQQELHSAHLFCMSSSKVLSSKMRCLKTLIWGMSERPAVIRSSVACRISSYTVLRVSTRETVPSLHTTTHSISQGRLKRRHRALKIATLRITVQQCSNIHNKVLRLDGLSSADGCAPWLRGYMSSNTQQQDCVERSIWSDWHGDCSCEGV